MRRCHPGFPGHRRRRGRNGPSWLGRASRRRPREGNRGKIAPRTLSRQVFPEVSSTPARAGVPLGMTANRPATIGCKSPAICNSREDVGVERFYTRGHRTGRNEPRSGATTTGERAFPGDPFEKTDRTSFDGHPVFHGGHAHCHGRQGRGRRLRAVAIAGRTTDVPGCRRRASVERGPPGNGTRHDPRACKIGEPEPKRGAGERGCGSRLPCPTSGLTYPDLRGEAPRHSRPHRSGATRIGRAGPARRLPRAATVARRPVEPGRRLSANDRARPITAAVGRSGIAAPKRRLHRSGIAGERDVRRSSPS